MERKKNGNGTIPGFLKASAGKASAGKASKLSNQTPISSKGKASRTTTKIPYAERSSDPRWTALYDQYHPSIVDPADVHSVLSERISATIDRLSPAEITFIQRRVRNAVNGILANAPTGPAVGNIMGRLVGSSPSHDDDDARSRDTYKREKVLDEQLVRRIFLAAQITLKRGVKHGIVASTKRAYERKKEQTSLQHAQIRKFAAASQLSPSNANGPHQSLTSTPSSIQLPPSSHSTNSPLPKKFAQLPDNRDKPTTHHPSKQRGHINGVNKRATPKPTQYHNMPQSHPNHHPLTDPIGAAYILMLHLAESRWDHVAALARLSALRAGLDMDVNKIQKPSPKYNLPGNNSSSPQVPAPAPRLPSDQGYGDQLPSQLPNLPSGASLTALCFIIAMAIRGTRHQKLNLLFYLLLPSDDLYTMLSSHPAGGVPSWLIESDSDTILSYASLSHYHYYSDAMLPHPSAKLPDDPVKRFRSTLLLHPQRAIETILILLSDALNLSDVDTLAFETDFGTEDNRPPESSPNAALLSNDRPIGTIHDLLSTYLAHAGTDQLNYCGDATDAETTAEFLDKFWDGSYSAHTMTGPNAKETTAKRDPQKQHWTQLDFVAWADVALDDFALDSIMEQLFSAGILPTAEMERELVRKVWKHWEQSDLRFWLNSLNTLQNSSYITQSVRRFFPTKHGANDSSEASFEPSHAWGGIGGVDGRGGLGFGIMYCVDKAWWEEWEYYCSWSWAPSGDEERNAPFNTEDDIEVLRKRPGEMSTERLLDRSLNVSVPGALGGYEIMKLNLTKDEDYVLVPPKVWDILYEIYGGGPPLPRMVLPPSSDSDNHLLQNGAFSPETANAFSVEVVEAEGSVVEEPQKIPRGIRIDTHPWVIHCHVCDPHQPYRRGDAGPLSIRIMAHRDQPLWKVFAEVVIRLPVHQPKARDAFGSGRARLWKRLDTKDSSSGAYRYGPWSLLCKNREAKFPVGDGSYMTSFSYEAYKESWQEYTDKKSVKNAGLTDGARLMFEFALLTKDSTSKWPREAAAKFGRARRAIDEDTAFRRMLRGLDASGKPFRNPSALVGKSIDAMDSMGRWYQVEITRIDTRKRTDNKSDENEPSEAKESNADDDDEIKAIRVDFGEHGGHEEWIGVKSDRLAVKGRFTLDGLKTMDTRMAENENGKDQASVDSKSSKGSVVSRKTKESNIKDTSADQNSIVGCAFPGYGACGLSNLGNTCYANSALQCISYMPLLRSYLLSEQFKANGDLNKNNPLGTGGKLLEEFVDLLQHMWSGKYGSRAPRGFRSQLAKARSQYAGADQQDAQELLNDVLDTLHEDSNRVKKKPYVEALEDDWVKDTPLPRVGIEAWRRFLRRNQSVVSDMLMGQVLNRVTCPICNHCSRNFDPFNMLSIPFPTVAEVIFQCRVVRRGTALNCPSTLGRSRAKEERDQHSTSDHLIEEHVIAMSRLADIGDLKMRLQNVSGVASGRLRLCRAEEIVVNTDEGSSSPTRTYIKVLPLPDKEGPCVQLAKPSQGTNDSSPTPTEIIAFESTLNPRHPTFLALKNKMPKEQGEIQDERSKEGSESSTIDEEEEEKEIHERERSSSEQKLIKQLMQWYGDESECRVYDTSPTPLSKAMSRSLWPESSADFRLGLRVDAIDHRNCWFPGSVVEIIDGSQEESSAAENNAEKKVDHKLQMNMKVRIHFDNFSSKWDETYSIDQFKDGRVRPLYSHASPRTKPTEFLVHHRHSNKANKGNSLFGQPFYLQCHNEWSTARAGAQILAQASRFLQPPRRVAAKYKNSGVSGNEGAHGRFDAAPVSEMDVGLFKTTEDACSLLSQTIDLLLEYDRKYVDAALATVNTRPIHRNKTVVSERSNAQKENGMSVGFNSSVLSSKLSKKLSQILPKLPFDVRVCTADSPLGGHHGTSSDEVVFPFSLVRTIGNYMNARHAVVLHWKERSLRNESNLRPHLYISPLVETHKRSKSLLNNIKGNDTKFGTSGNGDMHLGVCLTEFCKEQQLPESDNWRCPKCKEVREGKQSMTLWRLPDILTFHMKRFNCSARWREKITTKVNFPLTGLNMSEWCDKESPAIQGSDDYVVYDLIGVVNHYGGMTGGHYVATCKATACTPDGSEEVAHNFTGAGIRASDAEEDTVQTRWRLTRNKEKDAMNAQARASSLASKMVGTSSEPLWLQFDDDLVEPIPPRNVVSEMAYVLFYRRRRISPSNIAKYSTLE